MLCNASNREPTDVVWSASGKRRNGSNNVEQHLDEIRCEFQRMQQEIDSLGCVRVELEQQVSGNKDHKVLDNFDLLQMVSSTIMDLEESGVAPGREASLLSSGVGSETHDKPPDQPLCVQSPEARNLSSATRGSCRKEQTTKQSRKTDATRSTISRLKASQQQLPSIDDYRRSFFNPTGSIKTESVIASHKSRALEHRRKERLHQFRRIQESCDGAITAESLRSFVVNAGGELFDINLLINAFEVIAEKSRNENNTFSPDPQLLDFDAFMLLLDTKDDVWASDANPDVQEVIFAVKQILMSETNRILQQNIRETMMDKLQPPVLQGGLIAGLDILSIFVILLNTLAIGLQSGSIGDPLIWYIGEIVFFAFYAAEAVVKIYMLGLRDFIGGSNKIWNRLDVVLLFLSAIDLALSHAFGAETSEESGSGSGGGSGTLQLLKVLRLARLARLVRVMRFKLFKELKVMIFGLFSGLRALVWAVILLLMLIYVGGIVMVSISGPEDQEFSTLDRAMFTLFRCFTDGCAAYNGTPLTERLREEHGFAFFVSWILTTMVVTVGIFNLIMAVFIDNVTKSQQQRKQKELGETAVCIETDLKLLITKFLTLPSGKSEQPYLKKPSLSASAWSKLNNLTDVGKARGLATKQKLANTYFQILKDDAVNISRDVFQMWLEDDEFMNTLEDADVDVSARAELFDILDVDMGGELSADELVTGLMKLRGDVSKGDIVAIMLQVRHMTHQLEDMSDKLESISPNAGNAEI